MFRAFFRGVVTIGAESAVAGPQQATVSGDRPPAGRLANVVVLQRLIKPHARIIIGIRIALRGSVIPDPHFSVVFPAFNEQARLEATLREAREYFQARGCSFELIAVDDGSRDGTSRLVQRLSREMRELRLIRLPANRGKGYAVRAGMLNARGRLILFADADGSTPMEELERLEAAISDGADAAIGSRATRSADVLVTARWYRKLIGRTFHRLVELLAVSGIRDTQCGFKMFRSDTAHDLFARMRINGFSFDVEVLVMAQRRGLRVAEVPVNWTHKAGSRVNLIVDSLRMARDLFIIRFYAITGAYDEPHVASLAEPVVLVAAQSLPITK